MLLYVLARILPPSPVETLVVLMPLYVRHWIPRVRADLGAEPCRDPHHLDAAVCARGPWHRAPSRPSSPRCRSMRARGSSRRAAMDTFLEHARSVAGLREE
eukprot:4449613-Alexandrium_andersonii.AAC.1